MFLKKDEAPHLTRRDEGVPRTGEKIRWIKNRGFFFWRLPTAGFQRAAPDNHEDSPLWENARVGPGQRNDARGHRTAA